MNYFDFLRLTGKEDTKENFIQFLVDFMDRTKEEAEKEANIYF